MGNSCKTNYSNPPELEIDRQMEENKKSLTLPEIDQALKNDYVEIKQINYF